MSYKFAVPYQNNGTDCGVFVCRYAYAIYELARRTPITHAFYRSRNQLTESDEFHFNMSDIARIREEMKTLIRRLTGVYAPWKVAELQREKDEKAERKAAPSHEATKPKGSSDPGFPFDQSEELENPTPKKACSDLGTTETSTTACGNVNSNDVGIDSPLSPGGVPSVMQENHDRETAEASKAACGTLISKDARACKSSSPCSVRSEGHDCNDQTAEASIAACGTVTSRGLSNNTPFSSNGVPLDAKEGVSFELSSLSSTMASEIADHSNLQCLRHPGDPGLAVTNASPETRSIETGLPCTSSRPVAAVQNAMSGVFGSDSSTVLKDVENQSARSMEPQKPQLSVRCLAESLDAATSRTCGLSAVQNGSGKSECIDSSSKGPPDQASHPAVRCTSLHIASSSSSEATQEREEDHGQDDTPDCEMEATAADEVDAPGDLFPSFSAYEPMERLDSVQRGVALLTTNEDSTMETSDSNSDRMEIASKTT